MTGVDQDEGLGPMWGIVLIGWFVVLGTAFLVWRAADKAWLASASERFEAADGVVTMSGIRERGGTDYRAAVVLVTYQVDGQQHELKVSGKDGLSERQPDPDTFAIDHPVGRAVTVYYDPQSPTRAALVKEIAWERDAILAVAGMVPSLLFAWWGWRRRKDIRDHGRANPPTAA